MSGWEEPISRCGKDGWVYSTSPKLLLVMDVAIATELSWSLVGCEAGVERRVLGDGSGADRRAITGKGGVLERLCSLGIIWR